MADADEIAPVYATLTFLFTDIEGSTRLWQQAPEVMRTGLARHDTLLRDTFTARGGHVFKTTGDGFCVAFVDTANAVRAAREAQRGLSEAQAETPPQLRARMALHSGVVEVRDGDYFGL